MYNFAQSNSDRMLYETLSDLDVTDNIKDEFLDNPEVIAIGAENDPKINSLIEKIPEDEEVEAPTDKDLEELAESLDYNPEDVDNVVDALAEDFSEFDDPNDIIARAECGSTGAAMEQDDEAEDDADDEEDDDQTEKVDEDYEPESDEEIDDYLSTIY